MTGNFNRAMELARGKYVKFLCADDVLMNDCVERMLLSMESDAGIILAASKRFLFGPDIPVYLDDRGPAGYRKVSGEQVIRDCFFHGNYIGEPTAVMFRKRDVVAGFDDAFYQALDVDMWFRLLERGALAYFSKPLCGIRRHESMGTAGNLRSGRVTDDKVRLYRRYAGKPYLRGQPLGKIFWDARMASSLAKQAAAGAASGSEAAFAATYHPFLTRSLLVPLARILTRLRHDG
jgi:glycosyltransferase involved in cell wall biosynthesis